MAETAGRPNQRHRTRKDLLQAAARLMGEGGRPSLEEVAAAALVSRATAYRYFPNVEGLLVEAALDLAFPDAGTVLAGQPADPVARLLAVDAAADGMIRANEASLRAMLAYTVRRDASADREPGLPARQNRRSPLIDAALEPAEGRFESAALEKLKAALALVIGTEAMVVFKDVLQLDDAAAAEVRRWAIRALTAAALDQSPDGPCTT